MRILVLGGTSQGRRVADALVEAGHQVVSSLAGRTKNAMLPAGEIRIGGFGGAEGLYEYLIAHRIDLIVNATHPFAAQMAINALAASRKAGIGCLRLTRTSWATRADANAWIWVDSHDQASEQATAIPGRIFLTVGRQHSLDYAPLLGDRDVICRVALKPAGTIPPRWIVVEARGPFHADDEEAIIGSGVRVLITKDSGGTDTCAKLDVAARHAATVIMIRRPPIPGNQQVFTKIDTLMEWISARQTQASNRPS